MASSWAADYEPASRTPLTGPSRGGARRSLAAANGGAGLSTPGSRGAAVPYESPITTRSGRALGTLRSTKSGSGYSPYARRVYPSGSSANRQDDDSPPPRPAATGVASRSAAAKATATVPTTPGGSVMSALKGIPSRAFGYIFGRGTPARDSTSTTVSASSSANGSLPSSHSMADLRSLSSSRTTRPSLEERTLQSTKSRGGLPASSSLANLSSLSGGSNAIPRSSSIGPGQHRTAHSTLSISHAPSSRGLSPAARSNRSPSPTRNTLAGSMSAINFSALPSSQSHHAKLNSYLPTSPTHSISNPFGPPPPQPSFGLTSKSPFARSPSLFPYAPSSLRNASPAPASSLASYAHPPPQQGGSQKRALSVMSSQAGGEQGYSNGGRSGSPLNPQQRKKQLVWDPEQGLVSRAALERAKAEQAKPLPKNEAERILEVLESMGKAPEPARAGSTMRPHQINVPVPSFTARASASSAAAPSVSPYTHAPSSKHRSNPASGKGLASVLAARDERRRRAIEELRRVEEEERVEREGSRMAVEEPQEREPEQPRRKTRSMAKEKEVKGKGKEKASSAAPAPVQKKEERRSTRSSGRRKKEDSVFSNQSEAEGSPAPVAPPTPRRASSRKATSPPPPPPPPAPAPVVEPPPVSTALAAPSSSSSLRPGRTHTSRLHTASSKVFSAREEDLPPVEESALGMISFKVPAGFSFGAPAPPAPPAAAATPPPPPAMSTRAKSPPPVASAPAGGLFSRLGDIKEDAAISSAPSPFAFTAPATTSAAPKSTFSFADSAKPTAAPEKPAASLFSFEAKSTAPAAASKPVTSTPSFSFAPSPAPSQPEAAPTEPSSTAKPNFFGSVLASAPKADVPVPAPTPSFSFIKPTPEASKESSPAPTPAPAPVAAAAPASNPFAAFGKPISEIVKESNGGGEVQKVNVGAEEKAASAPSLSGSGTGFIKPAEKPTESRESSPFTFGAAPVASAAAPASKPFPGFGAPPSTSSSTTPFSFSAAPPKATAVEAALPKIQDADEDSGMEDELDPTPAAAAPAFGTAPTAPASGTSLFGGAPTKPAPSLFGAGASTSPFGAPSATPGAGSPFGAPSPAPTTSLFGGASTSGFGSSTSTTPAFGSTTSTAPASFGVPASSAAPSTFGGTTTSTFTFGATPTSTSSSAFGATPTSTPFTFGQSPSAPTSAPPFGAAPAAPSAFGFGNASAASASSFGAAPSPFGSTAPAMTSTLSASSTGSAATPFAFGAAPAAGQFTFGSQPPAGGAATSNFAFGTPPATPGGSTSAFNFGAPSAATGGAPTAPPTFGGFGAPSAPTTPGAGGGFVFGAGAGAAPGPMAGSIPGSPAPQAGGNLFNVGSGGDESPNKRKIAPIRRRK